MKREAITFFLLFIISIPFIPSINAGTQLKHMGSQSHRFHDVWLSLDSVKISYDRQSIHIDSDSAKFLTINNQEDFNNLNSLIATAIKEECHNIQIQLRPGKYEYEDNHILLDNIQSGLNIIIDGKGSELVSKRMKADGRNNPLFIFSRDYIPQDLWSDTYHLEDSIIYINDLNTYKFKIPLETVIEPGDLIKISQWFVSGVYEVNEVRDGYAYFSTDYLFPYNRKNWNVNYDLKYGKTMPRIRIYRTAPDESMHQHTANCFIRIQNSIVGSLIFNDMYFWGSAQSKKGIISLVRTKSRLTDIRGCSFRECKSPCVNLNDVSNVLIEDCKFTDNYNNCIVMDNQCVNTKIINNYFKNNNRDWYNFFDIWASGDGFLVADNKFVNSPYGSIRVGDWWGNQNIGSVKGIVENNLIYYTPEFYNDYWKYTLMDSGAIYVCTIIDDVHIRYNRIYDIAGMRDYRGIFGDDGTCNSKIYGNVITGIKDSYSIDLRATPNIEENPQYKFGKVNVGDIMMYNMVDGDIRFQGRIGENGCIKGSDFLLQAYEKQTPKLKIKNIYNQEEDIPLELRKTDGEFIVLSKYDNNKLKKNPIYRKINRWVK